MRLISMIYLGLEIPLIIYGKKRAKISFNSILVGDSLEKYIYRRLLYVARHNRTGQFILVTCLAQTIMEQTKILVLPY